MRFLSFTLLVTFCGPMALYSQQLPASASTSANDPGPTAPSSLLRPALGTLGQALGTLHVEKWKVPGVVRTETEGNVSSIRQDLNSTLPPLLDAADRAPGSVAGMLPIFRNVNALYDVLLRVTGRAQAGAPQQQSAALEQARASLEEGRRALGERLQTAAVAEEQQIAELQAALRARTAAAQASSATVTPATHTATEATRPRHKVKPRAKVVPKASPAPAY